MANSFRSADPEFSLLVDACAPAPRTPAGTTFDWPRLIKLARRHRVYPRLWTRYAALFPEEHAVAMRALVAENSLNALRNVARTIEAVQLLREAGIESIVLKGPFLAHDLYGDVALRVAGDVDLLVRERDLLPAGAALSGHGYRPEVELNARSLAGLRRRQHDLGLTHPDDDTLVELHAAIAQPHYGYRVDVDGWWRSREERSLGGDRVWTLSAENTYFLAAIHAAKHRWHRLDLISDMAALGAQHGLDRAAVHKEAADAWLLRQVKVGESLAAWLIAGTPPESRLAAEVIAEIVEGKDFGRWRGLWFDVRLQERAVDKARYLWRRLVSAKLEM